ncbi:hypothetical protein ACO1O0_002750 [Amphichorda felina]
MKLTLATLAVLATAVIAAPAADAEAWCERPGQSCWKAKRNADAAPEAAPEAEAEASPEAWCERPGQSCWKAKRDAAANAWCERPGQSCWKIKRAAEALFESIDTSGGLEARSEEGDLSNLPGGAAFKAKRALNELAHMVSLSEFNPQEFYNGLELENHFEPDTDTDTDAESVQKRDANPDAWCERPGQSCWKRNAEDKRWCERPGQSCWKAKRAAEAVLNIVGADQDDKDFDRQSSSFDPEFAKRDAEAWCERPGQSCWKRDAEANADAEAEAWCERPGQSCWKARRDLHSVKNAARGVLETVGN